ncbi:DUF2301 domain-containing membrane protein [Acaryochloris marina]|uniref:Conserved hypothetical membrane protein n=1 Tax=Acaryochloris marina (strain MBIC 11017) TaxID=329726 RepID=B0C3B9_ACAM1|nr:DUF2301 domain-containing membrane protein [Acaryochloris marina]ABW28618.1 conserved hypothetical membrane protein [Acaryochloris marina MBIC11017]BDM77619.1 hypothetical protein AM10699_04930 [Acaryochloris marina MBIC10699]
MFSFLEATSDIYQGHFGEFTISKDDRIEVVIYRGAMLLAASSFALGSILFLLLGPQAHVLSWLTGLFICFAVAIGVSLATIHIYMSALHRALQIFWAIGLSVAVYIAITQTSPLIASIYQQPLHLFGVGWLFVALTGIFFKEAFCFNHGETKLLTGVVPILLLGHWLNWLPIIGEKVLLGTWAVLFMIFASRKIVKPIPPDIGDKSVFEYLHNQQRSTQLETSND